MWTRRAWRHRGRDHAAHIAGIPEQRNGFEKGVEDLVVITGEQKRGGLLVPQHCDRTVSVRGRRQLPQCVHRELHDFDGVGEAPERIAHSYPLWWNLPPTCEFYESTVVHEMTHPIIASIAAGLPGAHDELIARTVQIMSVSESLREAMR